MLASFFISPLMNMILACAWGLASTQRALAARAARNASLGAAAALACGVAVGGALLVLARGREVRASLRGMVRHNGMTESGSSHEVRAARHDMTASGRSREVRESSHERAYHRSRNALCEGGLVHGALGDGAGLGGTSLLAAVSLNTAQVMCGLDFRRARRGAAGRRQAWRADGTKPASWRRYAARHSPPLRLFSNASTRTETYDPHGAARSALRSV